MASLDLQVADPLAVDPVVPAVVARGAQVKAGGARCGDRQWAFGTIGVGQGDRSVGKPPVVVFEMHVLFDRRESVRRAVGVLLLSLAPYFGEAVAALLLIHH